MTVGSTAISIIESRLERLSTGAISLANNKTIKRPEALTLSNEMKVEADKIYHLIHSENRVAAAQISRPAELTAEGEKEGPAETIEELNGLKTRLDKIVKDKIDPNLETSMEKIFRIGEKIAPYAAGVAFTVAAQQGFPYLVEAIQTYCQSQNALQ